MANTALLSTLLPYLKPLPTASTTMHGRFSSSSTLPVEIPTHSPSSSNVVASLPSSLGTGTPGTRNLPHQRQYASGSVKEKKPRLPVDQDKEEDPTDYKAGGYHPVLLWDSFSQGRYTVVRKLGWGHFSTVWLVKDSRDDRHVALKIMRSAPKYTHIALDEVRLLKKISTVADRCPDHPGRNHLVTFLDSFEHPSMHTTMLPHIHHTRVNLPPLTHVCMTFEPLGENLLSLLRRPEYEHQGLPASLVKQIAKQLFLGLDFLHEECQMIHTDLKPENVLVALEDVEELVKQVIENEPESQSIPIAIPPGPHTRGGSSRSRQPKQIFIFGSQPLPSPTHTLAIRMSELSASANATAPSTSYPSHPNSVSQSQSQSQSTSSSLRTAESPVLSTAPTSLGASMIVQKHHATSGCESVLEEDEELLGNKMPLEFKMNQEPSLLTRTRISPPCVVLQTTCANAEDVAEIGSNDITPVPSILGPSPSPANSITPTPTPALHPTSSANSSPSSGSDINSVSASGLPAANLNRPSYPQIRIKIADLGNATPRHRHYTNDIQTRQYRCPEVIIGRDDWDTGADVWSAACLIFEMLTSDYLFAPQTGQTFNKDDDHMAQIIELMGDMPNRVKFGGKYSREIFRSNGKLRHIQHLRYWNLKNVMKDKYDSDDVSAAAFQNFMEPMLALDPRERATAGEMCRHPWLELGTP